jgi:predicted transposase/invertase (TIGR01784 family)
MVFLRLPDLLKKFVALALYLPVESINEFKITNPELPPDIIKNKFCRLDLNMNVDGRLVDLEVQVSDHSNYTERSLYYWAKLFTSSLLVGEDYSKLPPVAVISILDFTLFQCDELYSEFHMLEKSRHTLLTDKINLRFFELPKLPDLLSTEDLLLLWLQPFKAKTEKRLKEIEETGVIEMKQLIDTFREVTSSQEFRNLQLMRDRARMEEKLALSYAYEKGTEEGISKGKAEVALNLLEKGIMTRTEALQIAGLSEKEFEEALQTIRQNQ